MRQKLTETHMTLLSLIKDEERSDNKLRSAFYKEKGRRVSAVGFSEVVRPLLEKELVIRVKLEKQSIYVATALGKKMARPL